MSLASPDMLREMTKRLTARPKGVPAEELTTAGLSSPIKPYRVTRHDLEPTGEVIIQKFLSMPPQLHLEQS